MTPKCITAVNAAAGRALTPAQIAKIDAAVNSTAKRLAKTDPNWRALSADQRTAAAGIQAVKDLQAEAQLKQYRETLQTLKTAETENRIERLMSVLKKGRNEALVQDMQNTSNQIQALKNQTIAELRDLLDAVKSTDGAGIGRRAAMFLFDAENPQMTRDLALEIFSRGTASTGNALAKAGADAWLKVIEPLRERFNAAGGDVGRLMYGYLPQVHDAMRVLKAGQDAWSQKVLPLLDRKQYLNADGSRMDDAQVMDFLKASWETIKSEGRNKTAPGEFHGSGSRANKGSEGRQIHFKDGESYLSYQSEFGRGSMYDAMIGHVNAMTRDIKLVEQYGPNPETQMRLQFDLVRKDDGARPRDFGNTAEGYWSVLSGTAGVPQNASIARVGEVARSIQTMGKLGQAVVSSLTDIGTFAISTGYNRLNYWDALGNIGRVMTKDTKEMLMTHGVMAESMIGDMNRFSGDHIRPGMAGRLAQSTLKLSGLNAWTDTLRNAFEMTMMSGLAKMSKKPWAGLDEMDRFMLEKNGVTEADWKSVQGSKLTTHKGMEFLSPESIKGPDAAQIVDRILGFVKNEGEIAVLNPDLATKAIQSWGGLSSGTVSGELARAVMQFKSFPIAMISRHWRRAFEWPDTISRPMLANPLVYSSALGVSLMGLGAIVVQVKQMTASKDPIDMTGDKAGKFWLQAFVQGGGASILGDMILKDTTEGGTGFATATVKNLAGPAIGTTLDAIAVAKDNIDKAMKDRKTHAGADLLRVARGNVPFVNLWYTKSAVDHMFMQDLQDNLSPGYLSRMKQRAKKEWGQDYWYKPGTGLPERAPDIAKAVGQ